MSLSLEHFKIIVDSVFEKRFAALKGNPTKNVVVELVCGKDDGIERATSEVIEAYFDELQPFGDCTKCEIPTTKKHANCVLQRPVPSGTLCCRRWLLKVAGMHGPCTKEKNGTNY